LNDSAARLEIAMRTSSAIVALLAAAYGLTATPAHAQARVYCCDDAKGRKVCGDFLPPVCIGRAYEERDDKGFVVNQIEKPLTPEQQAKRAAEEAKKAEDERKKIEERRRNLALLSTYATEADIDAARDRAMADLDKGLKQLEKRRDDAIRNRQKAEKEKEFYKGKPIPAQVANQIKGADSIVKAQEEQVAGRKAEIEATRVKFEDEKKKFRELKGIVTPGPSTMTPLAAPEPAPADAAKPGAPAGAPNQPPPATR
jgi:hypothetical protein